MRASGIALACALAGCGGGAPTALLVTVTFDDAAYHPTELAATVTVPARTLTMDAPVHAPGGRPVRSGDTFAVLLPDAVAGDQATVEVATVGFAPELRGSAMHTIDAQHTDSVTVPLAPAPAPGDAPVADLALAVDAAVADLAPRIDQSVADLARPVDAARARPDLAAPDLACTPSTKCAAGVETTTCGGAVTTRTCPYGCNGASCLRPDNCGAPGDVSAGGTFADSTAGYADDATGTCGGAGGADAVTSLTLATSWRTVTFDTAGSSYDTILYTRFTCANAASELPAAGPCAGAASSGSACSASPNGVPGAARLVLCNLPPGVPLYTWLDSTGAGGPYQLAVTLGAPSTLNTCTDAGNLLDGNNRTFSATTVGHANNFSTSLSGCGDGGNTSPDAVFFLAVETGRTFTFTTTATFKHELYVRAGGCNGPDLVCGASSGGGTTSAMVAPTLVPGLYFVVVDGRGGATGTFTLNVK